MLTYICPHLVLLQQKCHLIKFKIHPCPCYASYSLQHFQDPFSVLHLQVFPTYFLYWLFQNSNILKSLWNLQKRRKKIEKKKNPLSTSHLPLPIAKLLYFSSALPVFQALINPLLPVFHSQCTPKGLYLSCTPMELLNTKDTLPSWYYFSKVLGTVDYSLLCCLLTFLL